MDPNSPANNADSSDEARSQEIQNLKIYLQERFGKLPVLPGDPRSIPENLDFSNHATQRELGQDEAHLIARPQDNEGRKLDERETATAVSALTRVNYGNSLNDYFRHPNSNSKGIKMFG